MAQSLAITPPRATSYRWRIAALLGVGVLVNFFDRVNLSVAVVQLQKDFSFDAVAVGYLLSSYGWTYLLLQLPAGAILDRFGVKLMGRIAAFLWSVASFLTGIVNGFGSLVTARMLLGVAESPTFPANAKAIALWFPRDQRGLPTAVFDAAAKFASAIGIPVIALIVHRFGWRSSFFLTGFLSLAYFGLFWNIYRDPDRQGEKVSEEALALTSAPAPLLYLLGRKKVWGVAIGMLAYNYNFYLLLTWLPGYLSSTMHLDILHSGYFTAVPWLVATLCDLVVGGWLVDHLIRRGLDSTRVRQTVLVAGMTAGLAIVGVVFTASPYVATFWISIALSGLAVTGPVVWSVPGLIAPPGSTGRVGGIMNFAGNVPAIAAPIITGYIVGNTQSFSRAFLFAALLLVIGIASYILLLGRIEPIASPDRIAL